MRNPEDELAELSSQRLRRHLRPLSAPHEVKTAVNGRPLLNFSSNDYLGLANSPSLKSSFQRHLEQFGIGSGASRLVCGTLHPHIELEEKLAELKQTEAALTFSSGYAVATGVLPALCGREDIIILDKLCHACLIDGARLSGARMRVFPHNNMEKLAHLLAWAEEEAGPESRILVATESVFSMDGDRAPLREIVSLAEQHGALLLLDEAHAFGVLGERGRGLAATEGLEQRIPLQMGTFSKALGLSGGYLCANRQFIDLIINRARSFIYSTAPPPALAATISDALTLVSSAEGEELRDRLWQHVRLFSAEATSTIIPVVLGENELALQASSQLQEAGFLVPAIRFPTVPRGTARLRVTLSAAHAPEDILALKKELAHFKSALHSQPS